ncbi:CRISPR-associated helicase Cas3' [Flavitalea flava]
MDTIPKPYYTSQSLDSIWAKSKNYGSISLLNHSQQVVVAIEKMSEGFVHLFDLQMARKGAIIHDLGKAHPHFQRKIGGYNGATLYENSKQNFTHRHELSSLGFLPLFPEAEWDILIDLVVAHHKSIGDDPGAKGILDLDQNERDWIANHLDEWENWHLFGLQIIEHFDIPVRLISRIEAENALQYAFKYCDAKKSGWSPWRGLLKSADHFASGFMDQTKEQIKHLFEIPNLQYYHDDKRKSRLYPLSLIDSGDNRKHTLVVAPTGAGKTDFLLRRCQGRIFYTLPFQASINAMWERMKSTIPNKDIRLLHSTSKIVVEKNIEEQILQPMAGSAVKVMTPHQLAAIAFGTSGFESVMLDIQGCDVILDEIHTYSDYSQAMVLAIVRTLLHLDCRIHIGTATMPAVLYNELLRIFGGKSFVYEVKLPEEELDSFDRHIIYKENDNSRVNEIIKEAIDNKEKVLVIFNTVKKAQEAFKELSHSFPGIPILLIHSRFRRKDRVNLETRLKKEFNGDGSTTFGSGLCPCLVISTQVVEVSLDINFDRMITESAPLDSLIQRFGRVNRKRISGIIGRYKPIYVIAPSGNLLPYKKEIVEESFRLLEHGQLLKERDLQAKIDEIYPSLDLKLIDIHLIYKNGEFLLKELTSNKKSVIVEALEIESANCILESDRDIYLTAKWEERLQLEIPISWKTICRKRGVYEQLQMGSNPFVIPQDEQEHKRYGLELMEHENLL